MTAGRERPAGRAQLSVRARDRVALRVAGGHVDGSREGFMPAHPPVDNAVETNPVILVLAAIATSLAVREQDARARLRVVEEPAA